MKELGNKTNTEVRKGNIRGRKGGSNEGRNKMRGGRSRK